jgi:hypothetical protein
VIQEPLAELEPAPDDGAALARDDMRAELCQPPLLRVGEALEQLLSDREPEDAVAEELEPLVGIRPVGRPRRVREGVRETLRGQGVDQ